MPLFVGTFGIQIPQIADIASSSGSYSTGIFNELLPLAYFIIGIFIGVAVLILFVEAFNGGFQRIGNWFRFRSWKKEHPGSDLEGPGFW